MSYTDQTRRSSPASIAAVIGVHVAIAYALISGLAFNVIKHIPLITVGEILPDDPPPPPPLNRPLPNKAEAKRTATIPLPRTLPDDAIKQQETIVQTVSTFDLGGSGSLGPVVLPPPPQKTDLSRGAVPAADRLQWITTEDYPSAALRQGVTGTVVIAALIGTDGRVRSCEVTQSSGSALLDDATCRLYTRRAHFTPARDADGNAIATTRADRFRWQIPND